MNEFLNLFKSKNKLEKLMKQCGIFQDTLEIIQQLDLEKLKMLLEGQDKSLKEEKALHTFFNSIYK